MDSLNSAIVSKVTFEKVAGVKLPKNASEWDETILKQFYTEIPSLNKNYGVDVVVSSKDVDKGVVKGSVVVYHGDKQVNFPVIANNFELSPMDTFTYKDGDDNKYRSATMKNIDSQLQIDSVGTREKGEEKAGYSSDDTLSPGDISAKSARRVNVDQFRTDIEPIVKESSLKDFWKKNLHKDQIEKFAGLLSDNKGIALGLGDAVSGIIDATPIEKVAYDSDSAEAPIVGARVPVRKTVLSTDFVSTTNLKPIKSGSWCTIRVKVHPTVEDIKKNNIDPLVSINGVPVEGFVFSSSDRHGDSDHIFISKDGKYYASHYSCDGVAFWGQTAPAGDFKKVLDKLPAPAPRKVETTAGFDKLFVPQKTSLESYDRYGDGSMICESSDSYDRYRLAFIYETDGKYEMYQVGWESKNMKRVTVNGKPVYLLPKRAIMTSSVAKKYKASSSQDPVYETIVGSREVVVLPENAVLVNLSDLADVRNDIVKPSYDERQAILSKMKGVTKTAMTVGDNGLKITGDCIGSFRKIAGLDDTYEFSVSDARGALQYLGMSKTAADTAIKNTVALAQSSGDDLLVFGLGECGLDTSREDALRKTASNKKVLGQIADAIRVNLVKEASVLEDPDAVDTVLSLNFINDDNIVEYANYTDELADVSGKLSELLIAKRMGLNDVDEAAIVKSIEGIEDTIDGLNRLKMVVSGK